MTIKKNTASCILYDSQGPKIKNFVSGIGGFVASHLADYLIEQGEEVHGSYRWFEETDRIKHLIGNPNFHMIPMDLNDLSSCIKAIENVKPDYIFHLAAQSYVSESFDYPIATIETNCVGTLKLLEAIKKVKDTHKIEDLTERPKPIPAPFHIKIFDPVIHLCSSSEVYGLVEEKDIPIKETQAFNPGNPYACGKVGLDVLGQMYFNNYGMKIIRTRMFTHTSGRRTMMSAECNFAKQIAMIEQGLQPPIIYHGNLNSLRTWAHAEDAVRAYHLLVRHGKPGEVYNIGGETSKTIEEMLDYMISLSPMKHKIKKELDPNLLRKYDVTNQKPDISKFKKDVPNWEPKIEFEEIIQDVLEGWRERIRIEKLINEGRNKKGQFTKGFKPWNKELEGWTESTKAGFQKGNKNPSWKGGITSEIRKIRNSNKMQAWRLKVFERDKFTCQICKQVGGDLEAHHIIAFRDLFETENHEQIYDITNGRTLCKKCHGDVDKYRAKRA